MSTKEQERKALEQIKKIIDSVGGYDSYIGMAFEGAIDDAEDNIENDFSNSYYVRYRSSQDKINTLQDEFAGEVQKNSQLLDDIKELRKTRDILQNAVEEAGNRTLRIKEDYNEMKKQYEDELNEARELSLQLEAAQQKIIQLKAQLYDLICK